MTAQCVFATSTVHRSHVSGPSLGHRSGLTAQLSWKQRTSRRHSTSFLNSYRCSAQPSAAQQGEANSGMWSMNRRAALATLGCTLLLPTTDVLQALAAAGITKVFVAGSTGNTGRRVVQAARVRGLNVRAGVRDPKKAQGLGFGRDSGIEVVEANVFKSSPEELAAAIGDAQAVICATGFNGINPRGFDDVDRVGTKNLVDAAKAAGVKKFVLLSSLLTNAVEVGQKDNPNFKFLNLFGGVLNKKLEAEKYLKASGLDWTVVRPGGLSNDPPEKVGNLFVGAEDTLFGVSGDPGREISRDTVAEVLVEAALQPAASDRVFEIVSSPSLPAKQPSAFFADVKRSKEAAEKAVASAPHSSSGPMEIGQFAWVPPVDAGVYSPDGGEVFEGAASEFWSAHALRQMGLDARFL